jgi:periplasmic protein TonB
MNGRNVIDTSLSTKSTARSSGWGNEVAQRLIQHAARGAPPTLAERLEEEWLADLATRQGQISRLLLGLGCCWATKVIAREHCALKVSAATAAAGSTTMTAHAQQDPTAFSRRTTALVAIIGVHMAVIYAFATGLGHQLIKELQPPLVTEFLQNERTKEIPPPPPKVDLAQPTKVDLGPIPEFPFDPGDPSTITTELQRPVVDPTPPSSPPATVTVKRVLGGPGKGFPNSDDYYPPAARRLGEQGNTAIQVCVDPNGKLTAEPKVMQSSGSVRLDDGAIKLAKAGSGHYRATTENGTPVSSCYGYLIKFNLQ